MEDSDGDGDVGNDEPMAFMGSCFAGAMAISQAFFILSVSISSPVGGWRAGVLLDAERCFALRGAVKPGGSGNVPFDLLGGAEVRSRTHCGGGAVVVNDMAMWYEGVVSFLLGRPGGGYSGASDCGGRL